MSAVPALMSLTEVAKAIAARKVSSREVTQSCLDRIAKFNARLNAFMAIEADDALKAAEYGCDGIVADQMIGQINTAFGATAN